MSETKKVKITNKGNCSVSMYCSRCKTKYELTGLSSEQSDKLYYRDIYGLKIQQIIPEVKPEWREMFISGYCPDCWNKIFGDPQFT